MQASRPLRPSPRLPRVSLDGAGLAGAQNSARLSELTLFIYCTARCNYQFN